MSTRPEVVRELRLMFRDGATPSRLIRHIVDLHDDEQRFFLLIQDYFREAFGVPIVRGLNPIDDYRHDDLRHGFLNDQLIPQMIEHRADWMTSEETAGTWLEDLTACDDREHIAAIRKVPIAELRTGWDKLGEKEQYFIQMSMASANGLYEQVQILAKLAECLQQKINELEAAHVPVLSGHG